LLRGGEPFLFPGILDLIEYIHSKGIFIAIDTNGTMLKDFAADLVRLGQIHITISVDGPEEIHDFVRGVKGCFQRIRQGVAYLHEEEKITGRSVSQGICFTISPFSYRGLGAMPSVARSLGIRTITIVPYYYVPTIVGEAYERELITHFGCPAYSWRGFHHDDSGVDFAEFQEQYRAYLASLGDIYD
jgi:MoaA/NifB/PqqE/SkfB family radical SAM enzyme